MNSLTPRPKPPSLTDIHNRIVRTESRLVRLMKALGFDTEGNPLGPEKADPVELIHPLTKDIK